MKNASCKHTALLAHPQSHCQLESPLPGASEMCRLRLQRTNKITGVSHKPPFRSLNHYQLKSNANLRQRRKSDYVLILAWQLPRHACDFNDPVYDPKLLLS